MPADVTESKVLGLIQVVQSDTRPPLNRRILWFDENPSQRCLKFWNRYTQSWLRLTRGYYARPIAASEWETRLMVTHNLGDPYPTVLVVGQDGTLVTQDVEVRYLSDSALEVLLPTLSPLADGTLIVRT